MTAEQWVSALCYVGGCLATALMVWLAVTATLEPGPAARTTVRSELHRPAPWWPPSDRVGNVRVIRPRELPRPQRPLYGPGLSPGLPLPPRRPDWLREPAGWDHPATRPVLGANAESWPDVIDLREMRL